ncbi:MAG TPA: magnesium/cobalt transporter CorA [Aeromicrobium sp.]|nr:magnesium/cobalt transporter CorA [Aeromicrobium sp.]
MADVSVIDCATYCHGVREEVSHDPQALTDVMASLDHDSDPRSFLWVGLHDPTPEELAAFAGPLGLHPLAVEDALEAHQRPKAERYENHVFMSIRTVEYRDDNVETSEINMFLGADYLLTVRKGTGHDLRQVRRRAEANVEELEHGAIAALYAVVDSVVDDYERVAAELETDIAELEASVFSHERTSDSSRIYRLKRETLEFRHAVMPLKDPIHRFATTAMPEDARPYFRDIEDHLSQVAESIDNTDNLLDNALNAHLAQLTIQQNDDMRRLTAGATLFAIPTAIAGIYGMNFDHMPELHWAFGYPLVVGVTALICWFTYRKFRKSGWL